MKKLGLLSMMLFAFVGFAVAQQQAEIKFDKITHNFGSFSEKNPVQECTFTFTNVGKTPLVINEATASCGCTVPSYPKTPIKPGEKGEVKVVYNGKNMFPGHFKKTITIRTNGVTEMTRIYVEGVMEEAK